MSLYYAAGVTLRINIYNSAYRQRRGMAFPFTLFTPAHFIVWL